MAPVSFDRPLGVNGPPEKRRFLADAVMPLIASPQGGTIRQDKKPRLARFALLMVEKSDVI